MMRERRECEGEGRGVARENVSWLRSRVTTRGRLGFPRGGGKTRLVSLSLITILCVVVDDEGRRRASGPGYRQRENRPVCVRACAATGRAVRARAHAHVRVSRRASLFFFFYIFSLPLSRQLPSSLSFSLLLSLFSRHLSLSFPLFVFIRAPLLRQNARVRVCEEQL